MILSESDAIYAADKFINYFSNMDRIDEYLRNVKIERVLNRSPLSQFYEEEDTHGMFTAFAYHRLADHLDGRPIKVQVIDQ